MVFPQTPLEVTVALFLGGSWVDVTADVYSRDRIAITWGRQDWASTADTTKCTLTFNNRLGKYSRKNPASPYFGLLGHNTPVRIDLVTPAGLTAVRLEAYISSWPTRWDLSGKDVHSTVQANGITRRLARGVKPLKDPLRRHIEANGPLAYWPLTDGEEAREGSEVTAGSQPMRAIGEAGSFYQGQPGWGKGALGTWLDPVVQLPDDTTGRIAARVPDLNITSWAVDHYMIGGGNGATPSLKVLDAGEGSNTNPTRSWDLLFDHHFDDFTLFTVERGDTTTSSAVLGSLTGVGIGDGSLHMVRLALKDTGTGSTDWAVIIDGVTRLSGTRAVQNRAVSLVTYRWNLQDRVTPGQTITSDAMALGHITYWGPNAPAASETWRAAQGHVWELAGRRIERLCGEQGVPLAVNGNLDLTPAMGPQPAGAFLDLLQSAADVDGGILHESRGAAGLAYRTRSSKYNQGM